jgi:hypothetical protein
MTEFGPAVMQDAGSLEDYLIEELQDDTYRGGGVTEEGEGEEGELLEDDQGN